MNRADWINVCESTTNFGGAWLADFLATRGLVQFDSECSATCSNCRHWDHAEKRGVPLRSCSAAVLVILKNDVMVGTNIQATVQFDLKPNDFGSDVIEVYGSEVLTGPGFGCNKWEAK